MKTSTLATSALRAVSGALATGQRTLADAERVCRFFTGRIEFRPRATDIFVATYPRSGTTWVQFILYLLKSDRALDFEHIGQVSPWYERSLALGTKVAADFERFDDPRVFKTHLTPEWLPPIGRYIYIERDGLDVAISYYHLYRSHLRFRGSLDQFFERFLRGDLQYRSWFDHVVRWRSFVDRNADRVLALRYEDMVEDLAGTVDRIARFASLPLPVEDFDEVMRMASFEFMRSRQALFDPSTEALLDAGLIRDAFIRSGRNGQGKEALSAEQRTRFETMRRSWRRPMTVEWRIHDFLH